MTQLIAIRKASGVEYVRGLPSPVPGLAITDPSSTDGDLGCAAVTHLPSGLALGWSPSAESAAGYLLAVGGLTDWSTFTKETPDYWEVGQRAVAMLADWGGTNRGTYAPDDIVPISEWAARNG